MRIVGSFLLCPTFLLLVARFTRSSSLGGAGLTIDVAGYTVTGYSTGVTALDDEFFVDLTQSGTPDTGATRRNGGLFYLAAAAYR